MPTPSLVADDHHGLQESVGAELFENLTRAPFPPPPPRKKQ